jgi:hypothetical protein
MQFSSALLQKIQKTFAEKCGISPGFTIIDSAGVSELLIIT